MTAFIAHADDCEMSIIDASFKCTCGARPIAGVYPGWRGVTQPCDMCGTPVAVNAVSPSENHCSEACGLKAYGLDDDAGRAALEQGS